MEIVKKKYPRHYFVKILAAITSIFLAYLIYRAIFITKQTDLLPIYVLFQVFCLIPFWVFKRRKRNSNNCDNVK